MQLEVAVLSNPGGRGVNEDACGFWTGDGGCFCVVSDGAGGHGGGDVASKLAVRVILTHFQEAPFCTGEEIEFALKAAHRAIVDQQQTSEGNLVRMGDKTLMFSDNGDAFLMYAKQGRSWIALFDPIGEP